MIIRSKYSKHGAAKKEATDKKEMADYERVQSFFDNILKNIKKRAGKFGVEHLKKSLSNATFIVDVDSIFKHPKYNENAKRDIDRFLVDIEGKGCNVVLVSESPDQDISYDIYEGKNTDDCDHPIQHTYQVSEVGIVMFENCKHNRLIKALNIVHISKAKRFFEAWGRLSKPLQNKAIKPLNTFQEDVDNFWLQMNKLLSTPAQDLETSNYDNIPFVFSKNPSCPFYAFARKIKLEASDATKDTISFVEMVSGDETTQTNDKSFVDKINEKKDVSEPTIT